MKKQIKSSDIIIFIQFLKIVRLVITLDKGLIKKN